MHVFCLFQVLSAVQQTNQLSIVCEKSSTMMQFTPPEIWKQLPVLFSFYTGGYKDFRVFGCQSEDSVEDSKRVG